MPVTWIDGVTPVNAANLETMEADTAAAAAPGSPAAKLTAGGLGALLFTGVGPAPAWSDPLKFKTDANGVLGWGNGTTSDTNLYRSAAGALKTDGIFTIQDGRLYLGDGSGVSGIYFGAATDAYFYRTAPSTLKAYAYLNAEADIAARISQAGQVILGSRGPGAEAGIQFGSALDTNLYRVAANTLKTDDMLIVGGQVLNEVARFQGRADASDNRAFLSLYTTNGNYWWEISAQDAAGGGATNGFALRERSGADPSLPRIFMGQSGAALQLLNGGLLFGPAGAAPSSATVDTNLYRAAANVLKTDDSFEAAEITSPLRLAPGTQPTQITNFDTLNKTGWYSAPNGATGSPDAAESFHVHVIAHDQVSGVTVQFAYAYSTSKSYWRRQYGSWTAWYLMTDATGGGGGGGVDFIGTWGAGTAYKKGDVVRHNSFDYMAVNDSTGVTPPAPTPATIVPGVAYGTSLPSTGLYDGMEAILVDSLTAATYQWRFRYNAAGGAYKWEFVGGSRANVKPTDWTMTGAGAWQMTGATFTVPRAGIYECSGQARLAGGGGSDQYMGFSVGGGTPATHWGVTTSNLGHASGIEHLSVGAGSTIGMAHYTTSAAGTWQFRSFFVQPVKVA